MSLSLGDCKPCGRPLHDHHPDHVAMISNHEFVCAVCQRWERKIAREWFVKTHRLPGRETPPHGLPTLRFFVEPPASVYV